MQLRTQPEWGSLSYGDLIWTNAAATRDNRRKERGSVNLCEGYPRPVNKSTVLGALSSAWYS